MNFCSCGNTDCICDRICICMRRCCSCSVCHDLRRKERCEVCGLPFYRELSASTIPWDICHCESLIKLDSPLQRFDRLDSSSEVITENVEVSGSSVSKIESETKDLLQVPLNKQESVSLLDADKSEKMPEKASDTELSSVFPEADTQQYDCSSPTSKSCQSTLSVPECTLKKESPSTSARQTSWERENQKIFKAIMFTEQALVLAEDSESSSEEMDLPKQTSTQSPSGRKSRQSESSRSGSDKSRTSDISILELPPSEWSSSSRNKSYLIGNPIVTVSTVKISSVASDQVDTYHLRPASAPPLRMNCGSLLDISVSPVRSVSATPRTVLVSTSGELRLLPSPNSQLSSSQVSPNRMQSSTSTSSVEAASVSPFQGTPAFSRDIWITSRNPPSSAIPRTAFREQMSSTPKSDITNISELQIKTRPVETTDPSSQENAFSVTQRDPRSPKKPHKKSPQRDI